MDDADLVRSAATGDRDAWASIYDRYADRLHDYAWTIVRNREDAEDALQDTFVAAASKIGQLRDPSALRPWLYAICRNQALGRTRARAREVPTDEVPELMPPAPEQRDLDIEEMRTLVWDAAGGLAARDRAVLDLHLRQGLDGAELGAALEVSPHNATVMLSRVREHVDRSLGALLVARTGRGECAELDALLVGWDGSMNPLLRKRVARHIDNCEVCGERRRRLVSPTVLLSGVPILPAPLYLRDRVLGDAVAVSKGGAAPSGRSPAGVLRPRRRGLWWGAAAGSAAVLVGALLLAPGDDTSTSAVTGTPSPTARASAEPSGSASPVGPSASPASSSASPSPGQTVASALISPPTPSVAGPAGLAPSPTPTTGAPAAPPAPPPAQPPPPPPGSLQYSGGTLAFGSSAAQLTASLRNTGGTAVAWSVSSPAGWLTVTPSSGSTPPGGSSAVVVTLNRAAAPEGTHTGSLTLSGAPNGPIAIPFSAAVDRPPVISSVSANRDFVSFNPGCVTTATAQVTDATLRSVTLFWDMDATGVRSVPMQDNGSRGWTAQIGPAPTLGQQVQWWVVATDAGQNSTRADGTTLPVARGCP